MGLDMYLNRVSDNGSKSVIYLQKANQIHNRMLRHFEADADYNCNDKPLKLDKSDTEELLSDIESVIDDPTLASVILPTMVGFYFGETEYDEFYFDQLKSVHKELSAIYKEMDWKNEWLEYSCWW